MAASATIFSEYIYTHDTPVVFLDATKSFHSLDPEQQLYAHYLSKASWFGSLIILFQTSPESPLIFALLRRLFTAQPLEQLKAVAKNSARFSDADWTAFLTYSAAFYFNCGNYRGYGDSKFVPNLTLDKLDLLVRNSEAYKVDQEFMQFLWSEVAKRILSLEPNQKSLGFEPDGTNTYLSKNMSEEDSEIVKKFMVANNIEAYNTRAFKDSSTGEYIIRFASILSNSDSTERDYIDNVTLLTSEDGHKFRLERGDYSSILSVVNHFLEEAKRHTSNPTEVSMLEEYVRHFRSGSLDAHKEGSRFWIKNKGPAVETYIGFIENYRDPSGQRAEFEGFVTMVDREISKKFTELVDRAPNFLSKLPWDSEFEKDRFLQPDFTSLDVLTFAGSGIPIGINIPNYDEIRQNEGFKNVNLGNVILAQYKNRKRNFVSEQDDKFLEQYAIPSTEIITGLHELLGHGSGKLFIQDSEGKLNFDPQKALNPLTGKPVDKWYNGSETYDSKFGALGSPYEECRAEGIAHFLCFEPKVLEIFGFVDQTEISNLIYATYYELVLAGIESLKMYDPSKKKWLQAHSQGNYVLLRVLMESAECRELIKIDLIEKADPDGRPDLQINFTRDLGEIKSKCRKALGDFLLKLQVHKSLGDYESASALFAHYSTVNNQLEYPYLRIREIALARKKPRRILVQSSTSVANSQQVGLQSFEENFEGVIKSYQAHFDHGRSGVGANIEKAIVELWKKDQKYF